MTTPEQQPNSPARADDAGRQALADALRVSFRLLTLAIIILGIAYLLSGVFSVREHERAYVLLLGRIAGIADDRIKEPGLHWTLPKPFSEIVRVPAERIQNMEINTQWFFEQPGLPPEEQASPSGNALTPDRDGYVLTGDANIIHIRWGLRYTIRDPERFIFYHDDPVMTLQKEMDRAAMLVAHRWPVDRLLRTDIEAYRAEVDQALQARMNELALGIHVHRLDLLAVVPPRQTAYAFDAVIEAEQDRSRNISAARAYAARARNEAQGEASRILSASRAARQRIISEASADADLFQSVLPVYRDHPAMLAETLRQDRLRAILPRAKQHIAIRKRDDGSQDVRIMIGPSPTH